MRKKLTSALLSVAMVLSLFAVTPITVLAGQLPTGNWLDAGNCAAGFAGGAGTEMDPYQIATAGQLAYLSQLAANDDAATTGKYYLITDNLDLSGHYWTPIAYFKGHLNGGNQTISGLTIDSSADYMGLFGQCNGAQLSNIKINGCDITAGKFAGALVGSFVNGTISHCVSSGIIQVSRGAGGLVAAASGIVMTNSASSCNVTATIVHNTSVHAGGLIGVIYHSSGNRIERCAATGIVTGEYYIGGLIGEWGSNNAATASLSIADCYTTGHIESTRTQVASNLAVGGIVGFAPDAPSIQNCYAAGVITTHVGDPLGAVGGIMGRADIDPGSGDPLQTSNCYYNNTNPPGQGGGTSKALAEMQLPAFVATLNDMQTPAVWVADTGTLNGGLPVLAWQISGPPSASAVSIAGTASVGQMVTGSYTYNSGSGGTEVNTAFRWLRVSGMPSLLGQPYLLYTTNNIDGVGNDPNGPSSPAQFTVTGPTHIEKISNYHCNASYVPGTISLLAANNTVYGPWATADEPGYYWTVTPGIEIPAGTYTVIDSNPASWSFNAASGNAGMTEIVGYTAIAGATANTYSLQVVDAGHRILFEVTPKDTDGNQGPAALSAAFGPVVAAADIDSDGDGVFDATDNAPNVSNAGQADADGDGIGDVIDSNAVTIGSLSGGTISANPNTAIVETVINLTITPANGKRLKTGTLKYHDGSDHGIIGTSFTMPAKRVTVTGEFEDIPVNQSPVTTSNWSYTTVYFGQDYPFTVTVTDAENSTGTKLYSSLDNAAYNIAWIYPGAPGTQNITLSPVKGILAAGSHTLRYYAQDTGGAISNTLTLTFTVTDKPVNTGGSGGGGDTAVETGIKTTVSTTDGATSVTGTLTQTSGGTQVVIKKDAFDKLDGADRKVTVQAQEATVTFDKKAMDTIGTAAAGDVALTVRTVPVSELSAKDQARVGKRPVYDLTVTSGGTQVSSFGGGHATVTIPYTVLPGENPHAVVIWYLGDDGKLVGMPGHYNPETKSVTFKTSHFSAFVIGYNLVSFGDVSRADWHYNAATFLGARGITTGTGEGLFGPDAKLTRGQFIVMLMRAYSIEPDTNQKDNFADAGSSYYTEYLATAKRLGISVGIGNNLFAPDQEITRQELFTLLYNALAVTGELPEGDSGKKVSDFSDASDIAAWAKSGMTLFVKAGTISGSDGRLSPAERTTRAEMAQVLYNLLGK